MIRFGYSPNGNPQLADFQAVAAKFGCSIDLPMFFNAFPSEPLLWSVQQSICTTLNATPSVAYEPQVTLGSMVNGSQDAALKSAVATAKSYGKPIVVRWAHEFNGNWAAYGNGKESPESFVAGWVYAVEYFRANGAANVQWCWCPNVWGFSSSTVDPSPFFPGDGYVDSVALDGYMNLKSPAVQQFSDLFLAGYTELMALSAKPFIVGETGVAGDSRLSKAAWFAGMFETVQQRMPRCEAVQYFGRVMTDGEGDYTPDTSGTDAQALATLKIELSFRSNS